MASHYRYEAATADGTLLHGTLDVADEAAARSTLSTLGLTPRSLEAVTPRSDRALGGDDLLAFNEQLSHLARAGLPVEAGLKLLAADLSEGRLKTAVESLCRDLDNGSTLAQAIETHRRAFPPLYANLIDAGVRSRDLPGVLFNVSRHLAMTRRLRGQLSRAIAYPTVLLLALVLVAAFLSAVVLPSLLTLFDPKAQQIWGSIWLGRNPTPAQQGPPLVTYIALWFGRIAPWVAGVVVLIVVGWIATWPIARNTSVGRWMMDSLLTRLPLVGPALRFSLIGRWCDAARLGVHAGLDLPAAFELAAQTIHSPRLTDDSRALAAAVSQGASLTKLSSLAMLPRTVPATIELSAKSGTLEASLASLADLYLRQAEHRARIIPLTLTPILVCLIAITVGLMLVAIYLPINQMLDALLRTMKV